MTAEHTTLYDPNTDEFLFLTNNAPDRLTHTLWRVGAVNIYRPGDWTDMLTTVDLYSVRTDWPFAAAAPPQQQSLPLHPWIPYNEVTYGLADDEIVAFDGWRRDPDSVTAPPPHWDEFIRPVLVRPPPPELTFPPAPSAPPASASSRLTPPLSSHRDSDAPGVASRGPMTLPPHIQHLVIDATIATGATCPITMEPITAATAVITPCGHVFGTELTRVSLCPVCRSAL